MDGGYRSWITKIENNSPDLDDYGKPLPPPPPGFYWSRLDDGSWEILEFAKQPASDDFVTVESSSIVEHVVLLDDTLQGLCLRYGVSAVALRRLNNFSGNAFRSRKVLRVPLEKGATIRPQESTHNVLLQKFKNTTSEPDTEAKFYLEENEWDLSRALADWSGDEKWIREEESLKNILLQEKTDEKDEESREDAPLLGVKVPEGVKVVQPLEIVIACGNTCS
mmetsp:Transcript_6489/g.10610  ORF Transcript_6489/g.10610 Transcript_6489/m.10610 type:complete len:222 (+) Transcript_6489:220-885(+)|eukprot:CAMPEP_0114432064 /NCGR_PEP_ID=MMETSP0103-20121206/10950_1 /TAXON_ID=37642 ORGANISM="Paraphysomonas imperforata, Strain PA2" /NCGR_SAMPLE_ID=MMETSP0103 /ASSEMBLY_ACC=CAM_ASM_000201 /LENGTH=221 /DNA_ID=CAMNT_0001601703 /DNA_START=214 /DNA_END=879 /DNA_ORIENTATION=+